MYSAIPALQAELTVRKVDGSSTLDAHVGGTLDELSGPQRLLASPSLPPLPALAGRIRRLRGEYHRGVTRLAAGAVPAFVMRGQDLTPAKDGPTDRWC